MKYFTILFFFMPLVSIAQTYSEITEIPNKSAAQLYSDAIEWFATDFSSEENMVLLEDPYIGKIIAKGTAVLNEMTGQRANFKIRLLLKDGKYKFEVLNIVINSEDTEKPFDKYFEKKDYYRKASNWEWIVANPSNGTPISRSEAKIIAQQNKVISSLIETTESAVKNLMAAFKNHMKKPEETW